MLVYAYQNLHLNDVHNYLNMYIIQIANKIQL